MMPHQSATPGWSAFTADSDAAGLPHRMAMPAPPVIQVLPGVPESAARARSVVRHVLGDSHPAADTAMLLVSELVTNSVMHSQSRLTGGTVTVAVCTGAAGVLIQVRDDGGPSSPRMLGAHASVDVTASAEADRAAPAQNAAASSDGVAAGDEHGYGLLLVDALAETWGSIATKEGRVTWCRLAVGHQLPHQRE
jgi:anti-sigma regulatory factor (Ser/Thr protein kinase)